MCPLHLRVFIALALLVSTTAADDLIFLQIVWRHGDRAPTLTYPSDEHQEDAWPHGWGELTQLGMKQQFALGRVVRNRYMLSTPPFLSAIYNAKEIYVRSTDVNRTLISAMANMAGTYPVGVPGSDFPRMKNSSWPSNWTPIPIHTIDNDRDYVLNVFAPCDRAKQLTEQIQRSRPYRQLAERYKDFLNFLSEKTKMKVDLTTIFLINDARTVEVIYNMSQPEWFTEEVAEKVRNISEIANEFLYGISKPYLPELIKLRGGSLLKTLINNMEHKVECIERPADARCKWMSRLKYIAFSAHDTTVAALLSTFGDEEEVIKGGLPKYTASVAIELWNTSNGYAVKLLFHSEFHHKYRTITSLTKGCPPDKKLCPLAKFVERSRMFMPENIEQECLAKSNRTRTVLQRANRHRRHSRHSTTLDHFRNA